MQTVEEFISSAPVREISKVPTPFLVEVYNTLTGKSISKFSSRATGEVQVLKALSSHRDAAKADNPCAEVALDDAPVEVHRKDEDDALWVPGVGFVEPHAPEEKHAEQEARLEEEGEPAYRDEPFPKLDVDTTVPLYPPPAAARRERDFKIKLPFTGETRAPRPNSKRAGLLADMLAEGGISLEDVMSRYGWVKKDAYEGIRHIHVSLGYGIDQYAETGNVYAHTEEPGKHEQR